MFTRFCLPLASKVGHRRMSSSVSLRDILEQVQNGSLRPIDAEGMIHKITETSPDEAIRAFANLDHKRTQRTGFPEAVFAEGKTALQVAKILDDMARNLNDEIDEGIVLHSQRAILATRVTPEQFDVVNSYPFQHGEVEYNEMARIVSMSASGLVRLQPTAAENPNKDMKRVVVATAGTCDLPIAEEAAVTLEAAGCEVDRITDVGVAGLHRVIKALPRIQDPDVGCVIVCAGMDGALPSVVGGLAKVPVIAVPTGIGYGISLGGISAMLTMLNSCAPGVGVVNIDNGFGAACLAYKCILPTRKGVGNIDQ